MVTMAQARAMREGKTLSGDRNQCAACGLLFNSCGAFEKHRTGTFGTGDGLPAARRCLTPTEMLATGMSLNKSGFWVASRMTDAAQDLLKDEKQRREAGTRQLEASGDGQQVVGQP
ncbi:hypothetical protein [Paraburkholderia sp. MM5477-R1]|uniref:hypothetical protein n=1 Tax=Paraburkholderia sp. MM5477-R1 TaxID=2991062 RepID=UPI003D1B3BAE